MQSLWLCPASSKQTAIPDVPQRSRGRFTILSSAGWSCRRFGSAAAQQWAVENRPEMGRGNLQSGNLQSGPQQAGAVSSRPDLTSQEVGFTQLAS
eukprot:UN1698